MAMYITGSSLICRFPLGRNARPESCRGLHLPTFDKEQDIAAAKTSAPDEDTSTTALGVSTSELPKEGASLPFILGEGLPPVAAKLVVKIQRGDFVDMAELMRDNMEAERRAEQDGAIGSPFNKQSRRREVPDLLSWIQCFGTYISVVVAKSPAKVKQLLAYQTMIVREAHRCGGKGGRPMTLCSASKRRTTLPRTGHN